MKVFCIKAPAKVNLFLHVVGRMETGYHLVESLFAFVNLSNFLEIKVDRKKFRSDRSKVEFVNSESRINYRYSTVMKAVNLLLRYAPDYMTVSIKIVRNIPISAGLGSGSSDAGAVIGALGKLWDIGRPILNEIACEIGSDVIASIDSKPVFVRGACDELHPIKNFSLPMNVVLVKPQRNFLSVPEVYSKLQEEFSHPVEWSEKSLFSIVQSAKNDLQEVAVRLIPEMQEIILSLEAQKGCIVARMSGSGTACFGLFDSRENAKTAAINLKTNHLNWWVRDTHFII